MTPYMERHIEVPVYVYDFTRSAVDPGYYYSIGFDENGEYIPPDAKNLLGLRGPFGTKEAAFEAAQAFIDQTVREMTAEEANWEFTTEEDENDRTDPA